jgi:hypothetical protein
MLSGSFDFQYQDNVFTIPGFMVWMAVIYALGGSLIGHFLGRSMSPLNYAQQRLEANFQRLAKTAHVPTTPTNASKKIFSSSLPTPWASAWVCSMPW